MLLLKVLLVEYVLLMKKILPLLLLFAFFYYFIGYHFHFQIEQIRIKEEIKEKIINDLPETELTVLKISSVDARKIRWMEDGKEFRYEGTMFDVVKSKQVSGITYYYCFCDIKESRLMSTLEKLVKEQTDQSQPKTIQKKLRINYFVCDHLDATRRNGSTVHYRDYTSGYRVIFTDVLSPPPKTPATI